MKKLFFILFAAICAAACERTLDYNRKGIDDQLMMNAQLSSNDSIHIVELAISKDVTVSAITSGTVRCSINGVFVSEGKVVDGDDYLKDEADFSYSESAGNVNSYNPSEMNQTSFAFKGTFKGGDVVKIEATADAGKYKASSEVTVPYGPSAEIAKAALEVETDSESIYYKEKIPAVTLKCSDDSGKKNYYRLTACYDRIDSLCSYDGSELAESKIMNSRGRLLIIKGNDLILNDGVPSSDSDFSSSSKNSYNVFSDYLMPKQAFSLSFRCGWQSFWTSPDFWGYTDLYSDITLRVCLTGITKTEYNHLKALGIFDDQGNDFTLSEPVSFPDNVEGGVGVVSIASPTILTFSFPTLHYSSRTSASSE